MPRLYGILDNIYYNYISQYRRLSNVAIVEIRRNGCGSYFTCIYLAVRRKSSALLDETAEEQPSPKPDAGRRNSLFPFLFKNKDDEKEKEKDARSDRSISPTPDLNRKRERRRSSVFDLLKGSPDDDEVKEDPTVDDIRKWLVKNPNQKVVLEFLAHISIISVSFTFIDNRTKGCLSA